MFPRIIFLVAFLFLSVAAVAQQTADRPLLIGRVAVNQTHIAFTYAGKIWLVERTGGVAKRLTTTPNDELNPVFSPDGKRIAFSRTNGNDWDVFIVAADGSGEPVRVTMMPEDDLVTAWSPDGKEVIFETTRDEESLTRLYKTSAERLALATALPLHESYSGSLSPDAARIVYNPRSGAGEWRYYRGGYAAPLWIADLKTGALEKLSNGTHNDRNPVWVADKIFFVSDRSGINNLCAYDTKSKKTEQLTRYTGQGVRTAAATNGAAVYVQAGRIHVLDLATNKDQAINVSVTPDTSELATRNASAMRSLEQILPSPTGDRVVFGARGEAIVFDPANGSYKNLTNTPGIAERYPVISPDNKSVAYLSDESGEYAVHVRSLENDSVKKIKVEQKPSFYWGLVWSPDSRMLSFPDRRLGLWLVDVTNETAVRVDSSTYSAQESWAPGFSPDSRFLTYSKRMKNRAGTVYIYDIAQKKSVQVTDAVTHAEMPVFDRNGKYLYFVSSLNAGTSEFGWGVLNGVFANPLVVRRVHAVILSNDQPSLLLPNGQPNPDAKAAEITQHVKIDFDGLQSRVVSLPLPQRDYSQVASGEAGKLVFVVREWSAAPGDFSGPTQSQAVYRFDAGKGGQMQKIVDQINAVDITADGRKILYRKGRDFFLVSTEAPPAKPDEGRQDFSKIEVRVVPAEEWRQIFHESMRIMRDWFYDPNHHGQNLAALESEYAAYLPTTVRRSDLNRLMQTMLGSVSVSHLGVGGGDSPSGGGSGNRVGLLGADYEIANGKYRFKKIYRSMTYASPGGAFSAPLDQPGVDVRDGDYLLQVDGKPVEAEKNLLTYFENIVGRPVKITVSASADGTNARTYTVYPTNGENRLRRANWAEANRKRVEQLSGGKLGYIFIEGYGGDGIMHAIRGLTGYADKQGIIIDQRFNGGGITPDYLIEWMQRKPLYYYMFRGGDDIATPVNPAPPVKVMVINELNGSAAETGAFMFKLAKVGPLVGKRTFGGGIGPYYFTPILIDGGQVRLPNRAAYDPSGTTWGIENIGVAPDFDVEITPADVIAGRDPQLEKAVEVALAQISKNPVLVPKRPAFPVHPGDQNKTQSEVSVSSLPQPGSAFPAPGPKIEPASTPAVTGGKFAAFVGSYDGGTMGVLVIKQEGEKLIAIDPGGGRVELTPDAMADKFTASSVGGAVIFERDPGGKVTGISVTLADGRIVKGKKTL